MQLIHYIEQLSPSNLKKIMKEHQLESSLNKPNELVNQLNDWLMSMNNLGSQFEKMSINEREVLQYFVIHTPKQIFYSRQLTKLSGSISRDAFEDGLKCLRRKGILYTFSKSLSEIGIIMPENLHQVWHRYYFKDVIEGEKNYKNSLSSDKQDKVKEMTQRILEEDIYRVISYLKRRHDYSLSNKGKLDKLDVSRLKEILGGGLNEALHLKINISDKPIIDITDEKDQNYLLFITELAKGMDLITIEKDSYLINTQFIAWLEMDNAMRSAYLEAFLRSRFQSSDLIIQHLFYLLYHYPEESWIKVELAFNDLARVLNRSIGEENVHRVKKELLAPLAAIGLIEIEEEKEGFLFVKRKKISSHKINYIYVQPNYEIIIPRDFPLNLRFKLEPFLNYLYGDDVLYYSISKESMQNAISKGIKGEDIIKLLEFYSQIPITDQFKHTLLNWSNEYNNITYEDVRILRFSSIKVAKEIRRLSVLNQWIKEELSPTDFIVKKGNFTTLVTLLKELGYYPRNAEQIKQSLNFDLDDKFNNYDEEYQLMQGGIYEIENSLPR